MLEASSTTIDNPVSKKRYGDSLGDSDGELDGDIEGLLDGILLGIADGYKFSLVLLDNMNNINNATTNRVPSLQEFTDQAADTINNNNNTMETTVYITISNST